MRTEPGDDTLSPRLQRLFIALETNDAMQQAIAAAQQILRRRGDLAIRWVKPAQAHLTLQFLGNVVSARIPALVAAVAPAVAVHNVLLLRGGDVGAFPSVESPRVLWLGLRGADDALLALQRSVADAVRTVEGVVADRKPFRPHLTLGRVERLHRDEWGIAPIVGALTRPVSVPPAAWPVESVALFRSVLGAGGPRYTVLERFPLRNGEQTR